MPITEDWVSIMIKWDPIDEDDIDRLIYGGPDFSYSEHSDGDFSNLNIERGLFTASSFAHAKFYNSNIDTCDFSRTNFFKASMRRGYYSYCCFKRADIDQTDFSHTSIYNSWFEDAIIYDTTFHRSILKGVGFDSARIILTDMSRAVGQVFFEDAKLDRVNLTHADLSYSNLNGVLIRNSFMARSKFQYSKGSQATFTGVDAKEIDLAFSTYIDSYFTECDLTLAHFETATFRHSVFQHCNMKRLQASRANFYDVTFRNCNLVEADLYQADFYGCDFIDCDMGGLIYTKVSNNICIWTSVLGGLVVKAYGGTFSGPDAFSKARTGSSKNAIAEHEQLNYAEAVYNRLKAYMETLT